MRRIDKAIVAMVSAIAVILGVGVAPAAAAPPGSGSATIIVNFQTPDGVPGLTSLSGKQGQAVAAKSPGGTAHSVTLTVPSGTYRVEPNAVMAGTLRYVGVPSARNVQVQPGATKQVTVTYHLSEGVQEAHVSAVSASSVELSWKTPDRTSVQVRRTEGDTPATSPSEGVAVAATGTGLSDSGLKPGTQYNYSLWARPGDSAHGVEQANGPLVVSVGTQDPSDPLKPTYVVRPGTLLAGADDLTSVVATGTGVRVRLAEGVRIPAPGAAVTLPMSATLRGGFLGVVSAISQDGRTIDLTAGGLGDAFDFFHLKVDDLSALPVITVEDDEAVEATPSQQKQAPTAKTMATPLTKEEQHRAQREATAGNGLNKAMASAAAPPAADPTASCGNFNSTTTAVDFQPGFQVAGHFETKLDKYSILGIDVPTGVSLDAETAVTVSGALSAKASATLACQIKLPSLMIPLTAAPVPISYYLKPSIKVGVEGAIQVSNVGLALTYGYSVKGYVGFTGENHFDSHIINEAQPLTPQVDAVSGGVMAKLSAETLVGPGAGTTGAGVIVGLGGEITFLDAHANVVVPTISGGTPCLTLTAKFEMGIILSARAWLGPVDFKADLPIPGLHVSENYPFTPWHWPTDCTKVPDPSDDVLGDGVTMIEDEVTGSPEQWGYLDGFAPGAKAWVLSTGLVSQAQGDPSFFASTGMGNPGDPQLTSYSGFPTYDAAAYQVKLVPTGSTLRVKYAFASEEYPEYVGSRFNDAMAVFVDGKNCALVPGSTTPVSINTINHLTNAQYYVDNSTGASGYNTSYDGITTPLECSVPVTPGVPVTVRVAVADASDSIYDSAIALVDKGIWSD